MNVKTIGQVALISTVLFVVIFIIGSQTEVLASVQVAYADQPLSINLGGQPFTLYGSCTADSDCSSSICIYHDDDSCYKKWTNSDGQECINNRFCNYDTKHSACYTDSACTHLEETEPTCDIHYCCGTPQSDGDCTPHEIGSNYYNVYKINSDCSYTFIQPLCAERCSVNSDGSLPSSSCPVQSEPESTEYIGSVYIEG